jgi:integrase
MPYKRKDSRYWWVDLTDTSGKRVRRSTGTTKRKEAKALEAKWKLETHQQQQWGMQPARTFDELMVNYLRETQTEKQSAERDRYSTKQLRRAFTTISLDEIGPTEIAEYKRMRKRDGVKQSTVAKELRLLSSAINHARREWGWDVPNAVQGRCPPESPGRIRWITEKEAMNLIAAARSKRAPWLVDFIELGLSTGMRSGEMLKLTWDRVDLSQRLIYLSPEDQKNATHGSVPINDTARAALLRRFHFKQANCPTSSWVFCSFNGQHLKSVSNSFAGACRRAGITDFTPHDLRHTCASWLVQSGAPLRTVAELLRHKDIRTTMRYAHLSPEDTRDAVEAINLSRFCHGRDKREVKSDDKSLIQMVGDAGFEPATSAV